jgi:hypothetical protein
LGNGVGINGAGGPGILQILGTVAAAMPLLPFVTGVFGGLTETVAIAYHFLILYQDSSSGIFL